MENITIKDGEYSDINDVVVVIETEVVTVKVQEASKNQLENTIKFLEQKKLDVVAQIDEEIAINKDMLKKISNFDTSKVALVQKKIEKSLT